MEFKQLEAFVAVVDYKSFSEAAKHLYLTQPTISSHIQALEKELNSRLLIRTTKQMKVTDRGMQLYECAVHMLNMRDQITDEFAGNKWKLIDVSASTIPSSYLLPELLAEFSKIQPDIHFHIWQSDSVDAIEKVVQGAVDFGLTGSKTDAEDCCFVPFCSDSLVLAAPVTTEYLELSDALKKDEPVALHHFLSRPFILRANGSGTRKEIDLRGARTSAGEFPEALELIASKKVDMLKLLTKTVTLEEVPETIIDIEKNPGNYMKVVVTME